MHVRYTVCALLLLGLAGTGCPTPPAVPPGPADAAPTVAPDAAVAEPDAASPAPPPDPDEPPLAVQPDLQLCRAAASLRACAGGRRAMVCEGLVVRADGREPTREGAEASALDACSEAVTQQRADPGFETELESPCAVQTCVPALDLDLCRRLADRACRACGRGTDLCRTLRSFADDLDVAACRSPIAAWEQRVGPLTEPDPAAANGDANEPEICRTLVTP
jgi:hypothetical protein